MRWSTHALVGAAAGSVVASTVDSDFLILMTLGGLFGVLPDVDMVAGGLSREVHRSPATHSLLGASIFTALWVSFLLVIQALTGQESIVVIPMFSSSLTVFLASFLHAAADTVSVSGCRALYPLSKRKFKGPVKYDDWAANSAVSLVASGAILLSTTLDLSAMLSF